MSWFCYILRNKNDLYKNVTYNGSTNDPIRRLRQHNSEIAGGAKATHGKGPWEIYVLLTGFKNHVNALSCEWRIKHPTNKKIRPKKYTGVHGRVNSLNEVLCLDKWTNQCVDINNECSYKLFVVNDVMHIIDKTIIPKNIEIIGIDEIGKDLIIDVMNKNKETARTDVPSKIEER